MRGLRQINDIDWTVWFEKVSRVDALLREEAGFADLDFPSRDLYRRNIEELARRSGITEYAVAERVGRQGKGRRAIPTRPISASSWSASAASSWSRRSATACRLLTRFGRAYRKAGWLGIVGRP